MLLYSVRKFNQVTSYSFVEVRICKYRTVTSIVMKMHIGSSLLLILKNENKEINRVKTVKK